MQCNFTYGFSVARLVVRNSLTNCISYYCDDVDEDADYYDVVAAAMAAAESLMSRRSLSLSLLAEESHQAAIVRLVHSCTVQLLRIISICCTRHADDMQLNAVSTFCNLLQSLTLSGYLSDAGKFTLSSLH